MFQQMMASLLRTKRQLEGGRVLRREGSASARASKLGRLLWPLLRTSVAVAAFVALPALAVGLNDTGITVCGDATTTSSSNCAKVAADGNSFPRQDARYGRDAQNELTMLTKLGGGSTGFDFSRVTNDGTVNNAAPLGPGGTDWACTRDNTTGLTWEVKTTSGLRDKSHTYSFYQGGLGVANKGSCSGGTGCDTTKFVADVNAAGLCGASDWRLPTVKELENIVDFSRINPPIDPDYFRNTALNQYWTSTADSSYAPGQYFWFVDFFTGAVGRGQPLNARSVRLVRGTAAPTNQFTVTDGGLTVTDASTGLVWKRDYEMRDPANPGTWQDRRDSFSWSEALQRPFTASNTSFAGYSDWRLPNAKELRSLISEARHDPAINTTAFPATPFQSYFWSASPATDFNKNQDRTWTVSFDIGSTVTMPRSFTQYVRLVRGGDSFDNLNSTISLSTSLLNFDPQIVMTPSGTRVVTLSNYGKVTIGSISISTPASDYARTTTCTATLAVGQSCSISVTFTPTVEGARADIITISSDATNRPLSLNLAGTGAASEYALSITKAGTGTGTVSPWDVTCVGSSCTTLFPTNTDVTLTATQNTGSTFTGWSGSGCSGTGTCTVRMSQARTVTAAFSDDSIVNYSLTVTKAGTGSGTVGPANLNCGSTICSASYLNGTEVTLTATASGSSTFTGWSGSGCSGTGNCIVSMTQARSVTATFTAPIASGYSLTVTKAGTGSGTIGPANLNCGSTICSAYYASGTSVTLTATKAVGSTFSGWSGSGCSGTGNCIVSMTQARSVTATFTASTASSYSLTVTKAGTGSGTIGPANLNCGSTICSASYASGTNVTLTATKAAGSTFGGWSGSGCSGTGNCIVSMTQARSVTATFTASSASYALTVTKAGTGSGTVSPAAVECGGTICSASYPGGTEVTLTATVAPGSSFGGWSGSGCSGTGTCIVSMTQARSVTATFTVPPVSAALYDGIYQWDTGAYLSLHRLGADTLIGTIYWVHASDTLAVGALAITNTDTFDLLPGTIVGSTATISGTGFFRACKLSYSLEFNGDSTIKVTRLSVGNNAGVTTTDVDCAARYNAVGTVWTIPRIS